MSATIARFHAEWLNLIEVNGPFLTLPVLTERLRSGLEPTDSELVAELHTAQREVEDDPSLHPVWTRWVITRLLGFPDEVLREGAGIGPSLTHRVVEHSETLRPDFVVVDQADDGTDKARLLINIWPPGTDLTQRPDGERWAASPIDRIAELCRATTVRLGLVTNGDAWTLVDAPADGTTGTATWDAALWSEERATLDAFTTLLGVRRFFTVADTETLEALLIQSASAEAEVTDQLGKQVRAAVELLVDAMSRADRERNGSVFRELVGADLDQDLEPYIYEAAVTVLMRLVFLLSAEERGLFLLGDPIYDGTYAVSTLLAQLDEDANRYGDDVLERRTDAWHRLLATFRIVHAGAAHANLRLPPYGGSLFDPERFPFLEGRGLGQPFNEQATPLRIDNRTVKHILDALQVLRFRGRGGWHEARRLSFRSLGVEQIGHVYEGLLDHGVVQVTAEAVALTGRNDAEVALELIEAEAAKGHGVLVAWLAGLTGDSPNSIEKALAAVPEPDHIDRLASACDNDADLATRVLPYLGILRTDLRGLPQVYLPDSYYVTKSSDRRSSGAYYTPRALAEEMVTHTLEPLVYSRGPAEGAERDGWTLKSSTDLLDLRICDMAMGSGAFLVAACRYLAERLLEAWETEGLVPGEPIRLTRGASTPMPEDETDREVLARRLVADRCLYGVDRNPMAVEMAKLSLWLITLAKDRPFTFVDHALRCGDSLLGITDIGQLANFHLNPEKSRRPRRGTFFDPATRIEPIVSAALDMRRELESFTVIDIADAERKRELLTASDRLLDQLKIVANLIVGSALSTAKHKLGAYDDRLMTVVDEVLSALDRDRSDDDRAVRLSDLDLKASYWLDEGRPPLAPARRCFHWILEFPEVFLDPNSRHHRFDAVIGNPPFLGGTLISAPMGEDFRQFIARYLAGTSTNRCDLMAFFLLRAATVGLTLGLIGTSSIRETETRKNGLEKLTSSGWKITRAEVDRRWPGGANVVVSLVWLSRRPWSGPAHLNGISVESIGASLSSGSLDGDAAPSKLAANLGLACAGAKPRGMGFILDDETAFRFLAEDPKNRDVIRPYLVGKDLNTVPRGKASRWVIDFADWSEAKASAYSGPFLHLKDHVMAQRLGIGGQLATYWWRFEHRAAEMYSRLANFEKCIVFAETSDTALPVLVSTDQVLSTMVVVVASDDTALFGILSSSFHTAWIFEYASRMKTDIRYNARNCFETFPFPEQMNGVMADIGAALSEYRESLGDALGLGLTQIYARVWNASYDAPEILRLRELHEQLDQAVAAAYGWTDIQLEHGFYPTGQGERFTIGPQARVQVLSRLLRLNRERSEAEHVSGQLGSQRPTGASRPSRVRQRASDVLF